MSIGEMSRERRNVQREAKCPERGEMSRGGGPHFKGAKCPWGKMSRGRNVTGKMS